MDRKLERQLFKDACFNNGEVRSNFITSQTCRYCNSIIKEEDFEVTYTYWQSCLAPSHKNCKIEGEKDEAYECQLIDKNCNSCKHFCRGGREYLKYKDVNILGILFDTKGQIGNCLKHNIKTISHPKFSVGFPCFEHRSG